MASTITPSAGVDRTRQMICDHAFKSPAGTSVGENAAEVRKRTLSGMKHMGIRLDLKRNVSWQRGIRCISADDSEVAVLAIPTNEELEIAQQTWHRVDS